MVRANAWGGNRAVNNPGFREVTHWDVRIRERGEVLEKIC